MNEFIEKNRRLLQIYHLAAKILGWVLIVIFPFYAISDFRYLPSKPSRFNSFIMLLDIRYLIYSLCLGITLLGIARFIKYVYSEESRPGWILRHLEKFLYIYAFLMVVGIFVEFFHPAISSKGISLKEIYTCRHK
jgi:VIT1/CCC1 family predicted Fe2+/Mn2+ transporter